MEHGAIGCARGAAENPTNRFERIEVVDDPEFLEVQRLEIQGQDGDSPPALRTQFFRDPSRSIIAWNGSPDLPFEASLNPYRGCEHGCIYCYARPFHEYLGFSAGLDFESRILVKDDAPVLLRRKLASARWTPQVVVVGAATDPYQPIEGRMQITRRCLEVFADFRNPVSVITKSSLVVRDADWLESLAAHGAAAVNVSETSLDRRFSRLMEPRAAPPERRLEAVSELHRRGIPVGVMLAPVIPGLTDHEIPQIVAAAAQAGAQWLSAIVLRLPYGVAPLFESWLERHFPDRAKKVMNRIRAVRGGRANDPRFHSRMRGTGIYAEQIHALVALARRRAGIPEMRLELSAAAFRPPPGPQLSLF
jgi:DNA repair photolyase